MSRLPPVDLEALSPAQQKVADSIAGGSRGRVRGPFLRLLHSPELAAKVEQLGAYLRYECSVPVRQRELTILAVARHWRSDYEWFAHAPLAQAQGVPEAVLAQVGTGEEPAFDDPADAAVFRFVAELLREGRVSDATYAPALELLGKVGVLDLTGLAGYYSLLALVLNTFQVAAPEPAKVPWHAGG